MTARGALLLLAVVARAQAPQAPELPPARLEGRVVDPQQRPVVGAEVIAELDAEPLGRTFTDAQGTFVFGKLPARIVTVRTTTKAPDVGGSSVDLFGIGRGSVRIVTMPARKVAGIVRDDAGQPVAGAWVVAAPNDAIEFAHCSCMAQSDPNGRYELTHAAMGSLLVRAWAPGCDAFDGRVGGTADVVLDPVVERNSVMERRLTLAAATPEQLARAELHVRTFANGQPFPLPPPLRRPPRGADGAWILSGWPDDLLASLVVPGLQITPLVRRVPSGFDRFSHEFAIDDAEATIHGDLTTEGGPDVGGRKVVVQPLDDAPDNYNRIVVTTRHDGTFTLPSPVDCGGTFALRLDDAEAVVAWKEPELVKQGRRGPAYWRFGVRAWFVADHTTKAHHTVKISAANRIRFGVRTPDGTPADGASVVIHMAPHGAAARASRGPGAAPDLAEVLASQGAIATGRSDLDGNVEIVGLDLHAKEELACLVLGEHGFGEVTFEVDDRRAQELGSVKLGEAATLAGTCLDADGKPVPARRVAVVTRRPGEAVRQLVASDRDGKFVVRGMLPGLYTVVMLDENSPPQFVTLKPGVTGVTLR